MPVCRRVVDDDGEEPRESVSHRSEGFLGRLCTNPEILLNGATANFGDVGGASTSSAIRSTFSMTATISVARAATAYRLTLAGRLIRGGGSNGRCFCSLSRLRNPITISCLRWNRHIGESRYEIAQGRQGRVRETRSVPNVPLRSGGICHSMWETIAPPIRPHYSNKWFATMRSLVELRNAGSAQPMKSVVNRDRFARNVRFVCGSMEAIHPHLTTQKSFYVEISRDRHRAELVTNDREALKERLEAVTGERIAALEAVAPDQAKAPEPEREAARESRLSASTGRDTTPGENPEPGHIEPERSLYTPQAPTGCPAPSPQPLAARRPFRRFSRRTPWYNACTDMQESSKWQPRVSMLSRAGINGRSARRVPKRLRAASTPSKKRSRSPGESPAIRGAKYSSTDGMAAFASATPTGTTRSRRADNAICQRMTTSIETSS